MNLTEEFKQFLYNEGANLVGIGNITDVKNARYPIGVSIALALPTKIIRDLFQHRPWNIITCIMTIIKNSILSLLQESVFYKISVIEPGRRPQKE